jgi:hypothetical protein
VNPVCAFYASTLIAIWQRLVSLHVSWDLDVLGKVIRRGGYLLRLFLLHVIDVWYTSFWFTNPSEMSSAGAEPGRYSIAAFKGFWEFG